ncbi:helix-turn-helix domain-containing protein [Actinomadura syzygii]|uniref:helix-turn-helix domain-containing protein n=1 Tax=Actinomadura syzygii TaxID=1427538 RepID=UPI001CA36A8D
MSRFRLYPTPAQAQRMLEHCAHARYAWNLAVEQYSHWRHGRKMAPGFAEQCRQLTEARRDNEWLASGNADVQQQALKDFAKAKNAKFTAGFGEPTWRKNESAVQCLRMDREEVAQEPSRLRMRILRVHLQRRPQREHQHRGRTGRDPAPGHRPVPEGRQRPPAVRASVNHNPHGLKSPSPKRGRMSI